MGQSAPRLRTRYNRDRVKAVFYRPEALPVMRPVGRPPDCGGIGGRTQVGPADASAGRTADASDECYFTDMAIPFDAT
jgi:hypothetical protein